MFLILTGACTEACGVLKPGGKFGFTVWATPGENPYAKIIDDVIREHADLEVDLPVGPPHHLFSDREDFRRAGLLARQTPARLHAIQSAIEESVRRYAKDDGFAIPTAAYIITASKKEKIAEEEERTQRAAA